jgi:thiol-disulfide isomerase/thioredoxin
MPMLKLSRHRIEQILLFIALVVAFRYLSGRQSPNMVGKVVDGQQSIVEIAAAGVSNVARPTLKISELISNNVATVFVFTASWCSTCKAEAPQLNRLYQETRESGVPFFAVHVDDTEADALNFTLTHQHLFNVALDVSGSFAGSVEVRAVPQTIIVDRTGAIRFHLRGPLQTANFESVKNAIMAANQPILTK